MDYEVKDIELAPEGKRAIDWVEQHMPTLMHIKQEFSEEKPLEGLKVSAALHVEAKTASLMRTLKAGGAKIAITGCNPLSTIDSVAAELANENINVFAWRGEAEEDYYKNLDRVLDQEPDLLIDDGADLIARIHSERSELLSRVKGGTEETTTGVNRLRAMSSENELKFPVIAVNDTPAKRLFDNRFGTAESTLQAIMTITNSLIAGKNVVVVGYGFVGRGIALRAKGLGATVTVVETDPIRALEASMMGFNVTSMNKAAKTGDIFITATGNIHVIRKKHFKKMKDGAILCNSGHFNVEINLQELEELSVNKKEILDDIEEFQLENGKRIHVLAQGRLVNLAGEKALGHPAEIMDMSFSLQALSLKHLAENEEELENKVHEVPREIDRRVAEIKLKSRGIELETPTKEQNNYSKSWKLGT
ncbi:MAG: adenosylhomocysteinase [Hadesarchaea archaeon]|nr:adenosylhomocysteinase [Hadesarchaea archaeon]